MARKTGGETALRFAIKSVDPAQRIIEGYASTPAEDAGADIVELGACKFRDPNEVLAYVGHQWRLGSLPVGQPLEIRQDEHGLFTKTRIHETTAGDDLLAVAAAMQNAGTPLGISIGYPPASVKASYERKDGHVVRRIKELELKEYSFTAIPMNDSARVTAVKAADMSDEEKRAEIQEAINARGAGPLSTPSYSYVCATYPDHVIVCDGDDYWKIPYTINAEGEADLGEPTAVEQVWQPKSAAPKLGTKVRAVLEAKAGRVLRGDNVARLQTIHDATHAMATSAGHDLHETDEDMTKSKSHDSALMARMLELDFAAISA